MNPEARGSNSTERAVGAESRERAPRPRSFALRLTLSACAAALFVGFLALGTWQLKRLQWKLDLIERVEQRVHAPAVVAPSKGLWPQVNAASDEYRHVSVTGTFLYELTTRVQASTERGSGFWLLTPLRSADGSVVLVNRGFVATPTAAGSHIEMTAKIPVGAGAQEKRASEPVISTVTGLLRMTEPGGAFLRRNDPAVNRWYSRDVQAIAAAHGLGTVAPYFVDADARKELAAGEPDHPVGGLTVIVFPNNHLVYAITWYVLAMMVAGAFWWVARDERRLRLNHGGVDADIDRPGRESEDAKRN